MSEAIKISVVIATHNRKEMLRRCLTAVTHQSCPPHEIIVVDDASTDGTDDMLRHDFPHVIGLRQTPNQGPATARNRGLETATGDDCIVPHDWLACLQDGFARHPDVAGVSGYQEAPETLLRHNAAAQAERARRLQRWGHRAAAEQKGGYEVPGFGTNNVAYRRDALLQINGFDTTFPVAAGEDADLKLRMAQAGYTLLYMPLKVEHHQTYSLIQQWRAWYRRGIGAYYFEAKHGRKPGLCRILLRFAKRSALFFPNLRRHSLPIALVLLITRLADACGQLKMALRRKDTA